MVIRTLFFVSLVFLSYGVRADAQPLSAKAWLEKMSISMQTTDYEGTFIYFHDGEMEVMNLSHTYDEQGEIERLVSLNGVPREIIRDYTNVICVWPDSKSAVVSRSRKRTPFPVFSSEILKKLDDFYEFLITKKDRIANRVAQQIEVKPKDALRYGYNIWVDEASYLLLRSDLVNVKGKMLEQVTFTRMEQVEGLQIEQFTQEALGSDYRWVYSEEEAAQGSSQHQGWKFATLPAGFELISMQLKPMYKEAEMVNHLILSDGLATVSVYVAPTLELAKQSALQGESTMGAVNAYGMVKGHLQVTAVGEVPMATIKHVVNALKVKG